MSEADAPSSDRPRRRRLGIRFAAFIRWLHIYVSMFGLAAVLFAVGLVALWGRSFALRRVGSAAAIGAFARVAPVLSAAVITLVGAAISVLAVSSFATAA